MAGIEVFSYTVGLRLVGAEGRVSLLSRFVDIGGDIQGISVGRYGRYVQGGGNVGLMFGRLDRHPAPVNLSSEKIISG